MENSGQAVEALVRAGMNLECATKEQLDIINTLSSVEVDMLIGLKSRLNSVETASTECGGSGYFVW
ncbi:aroma-sacti cluster domain-containing protein [Streptomyces bobili]